MDNNYDVLIYSSPKCAGNTLQANLLESNIKTYYTHSMSFFTGPFPGQNNPITLKEFININSENKTFKIINIYRDELEACISFFFQVIEAIMPDYDKKTTEELIDYFNGHMLKYQINNFFKGFFELYPEEYKNLQYFDHNKKYHSWKKGNIEFIILRYRDIKLWHLILNDIFDLKLGKLITSRNESINKDYYNKYLDFLEKYKLPKEIYNKIFDDPRNIFKYMLTEEEYNKYKNKLLLLCNK